MRNYYLMSRDEWEKMLEDLAKEYGIDNTGKVECECGALHTSFPDHHLGFCPLLKKKKEKE